jgi:hypothetical protein
VPFLCVSLLPIHAKFRAIDFEDLSELSPKQQLALLLSYLNEHELFDSWRAAGADFILTRANGKVERGHFNFDHGDLGGMLHDEANPRLYE